MSTTGSLRLRCLEQTYLRVGGGRGGAGRWGASQPWLEEGLLLSSLPYPFPGDLQTIIP